jgi:alpha-1,6-mannosyltransferase
MLRQKPIYYLLILVSVIGYFVIAFSIQRFETQLLLPAYTVIFLAYLWMVRTAKDEQIVFYIGIAFLFRFIFLFALPILSDDFYRFIWDGRLWSAGYHPFAELPSSYVQQGITGIDRALFLKLNSPEYFTIYPPVSQLVFWISVKISPQSIMGSVLAMRIILLLAEAGSIFIMYKLLKRLSLPVLNILLFALNPLVIIELTGNLHFEGLIIFFILLTAYLLLRNQWISSAITIALAIASKLVPAIFLPSLISRMGIKNSLTYGLVVGIALMVVFLPLFDKEVIQSMSESMGLYFNRFEFNASLYYLVREYGFWKYGYNIIQTVGWKLGLMSLLIILTISFKNGLKWEVSKISVPALISDWLWVLSTYFLFTTILHPWYITTLIALSIFTTYRFPIVWSAMIFLTYAGYTQNSFHENLWLTATEYVVVVAYLIYELKSKQVFNFLVKKNEI